MVNASGVITAKGEGTAWITARSPIRGVSASCSVTVIGIGRTVVLDGNTYIVNKGRTLTFKAASFNEEQVTIPAKVTVSGISYKVTKIDPDAFARKSNITKVTIGSKVESIPARLFEDCTDLTSVVIGAGVKTIGTQAFKNCRSLKKVTIRSAVLNKINKNAFRTIKRGAVITCPKSRLTAYKKMLKASGLPADVIIK